jgi:hypothetical protein
MAHWANVLTMRGELVDASGELGGLQMSLFSAVYQTQDVPYRDPAYYGEITQPTPGLVRFLAKIAHRLGSERAIRALFHLDQGMGGGKSHALVGVYHMANSPEAFFATEIGERVREEAEELARAPLDLGDVRTIVLSADNMSPGVASPEFGPATSLFERFLWALFDGDRSLYDEYRARGSDKRVLSEALAAVGKPVLILLDELMDYALRLSDEENVGRMPGEEAFLNSLMDAVDEQPRVAFVVVMIRSELEETSYGRAASEFRDYVAARLERNGETVSVSDAQDFAAIIRRRLFERAEVDRIGEEVAGQWTMAVDEAWRENVFDRLPGDRGLSRFGERLSGTYPFHPDLMDLVRDDWARRTGFQRVRSTVSIFAQTAFHWGNEQRAGKWSPELIGLGDIPLETAAEHVLSSGLLHGNDRAVQGYRQVAAADIISKDASSGRAAELDLELADEYGGKPPLPRGAVRMATALFLCSLVPRAQAKRGATRPELLASVYMPGVAFADADEVFVGLTGEEGGLGALDVIQGTGGNTPTRYQLSIAQTLRMFFRQARDAVSPDERDTYIWDRVEEFGSSGRFDRSVFVSASHADASPPLAEIFGEVDQQTTNRLVVLDPRRWALRNGSDGSTTGEVDALFGQGPDALPFDNAASCVVACINTQGREAVRKRAAEALAYRAVIKMLDPDDELRAEATERLRETERRVDEDLKRAFRHFAYLTRDAQQRVHVEWLNFDEAQGSSLLGNYVWESLVSAQRASNPGQLSGSYLVRLLDVKQRPFSLREIARRFWQDPSFPLVPSEAEVRRAIFEALELPPPDGWEIVGPTGDVLTITDPSLLALGAMDQMVRPKSAPIEEDKVTGEEPGDVPGDGRSTQREEKVYKRYRLKLEPRSVTQREARQQVWHLASGIADALDTTSGVDVQLVQAEVMLTAAEGSLAELSAMAEATGAVWAVEEEDF